MPLTVTWSGITPRLLPEHQGVGVGRLPDLQSQRRGGGVRHQHERRHHGTPLLTVALYEQRLAVEARGRHARPVAQEHRDVQP